MLTRAGRWVKPLLLGVLDDHSRLVCHLQWYLSESAEVLEILSNAAIPSRYEAGSIIFLQDEPARGLFVVGRGVVKISRVSRDGREQIMQLMGPGDTFNEVSVLDGGPNPATATRP